MRKLLIIICIGLVLTLTLKYLTGKKEEAAKAAATSFLEAMKQKDVNNVMEYMDYDEVVLELNMWAKIGGGDFTPSDVREQLKKNMEKSEFDYEILNVKAAHWDSVKVTARVTENGEVKDGCLIMKKKNGKWKCDLMATGREAAKMEK